MSNIQYSTFCLIKLLAKYIMDKKELSLISIHHDKLINHTFDEYDIYTLLILIRSHSRKHSPLHEISDFIAHREKDRGKIHRYLSKCRKEAIKATKKKPYKLIIKEVFSEEQLTSSINEVFNKYNFKEIDNKTGAAIMLCVMSLLQNVKLIEKNKTISTLVLSFPKDGEKITLFSRIPVPHHSGKGTVFLAFAVLRTSYVPSNFPSEADDSKLYSIVNDNNIMGVHIEQSTT